MLAGFKITWFWCMCRSTRGGSRNMRFLRYLRYLFEKAPNIRGEDQWCPFFSHAFNEINGREPPFKHFCMWCLSFWNYFSDILHHVGKLSSSWSGRSTHMDTMCLDICLSLITSLDVFSFMLPLAILKNCKLCGILFCPHKWVVTAVFNHIRNILGKMDLFRFICDAVMETDGKFCNRDKKFILLVDGIGKMMQLQNHI